MAYADGRLFVPVVDLCGRGSATTSQKLTTIDPSRGRGRLVALDAATGHVLWERRLPSPDFGCATVSNDLVLTSTYDGSVYAFTVGDGKLVWHARMRAGMNACPAVVDDLVLFGAGIRLTTVRRRRSWRSACPDAYLYQTTLNGFDVRRMRPDPRSRSVTR